MKKQRNNKDGSSDSFVIVALVLVAVFLFYQRFFGIAVIGDYVHSIRGNIIGIALLTLGLLYYSLPLYRYFIKRRPIRMESYGWGTLC